MALLLWLSLAASALAWFAAALILTIPLQRAFLRISLRFALALVPAVAMTTLLVISLLCAAAGIIRLSDFLIFLCAYTLFAIGAIRLLRKRWWRTVAEKPAPQQRTLRLRLVLATGLTLALHLLILIQMEAAARGHLKQLQAQNRAELEPLLAQHAQFSNDDAYTAYAQIAEDQQRRDPGQLQDDMVRQGKFYLDIVQERLPVDSFTVSWEDSARPELAEIAKVKETLAQFMVRQQPLLARCRATAAMPVFRSEWSYDELCFHQLDYTVVMYMTDVLPLFELDLRDRLSQGDYLAVESDIATVYSMARQLLQRPTLINVIWARQFSGRIASGIELLLNTPGLTAEQLESLQIPDDIKLQETFHPCFPSETAGYLAGLQRIFDGDQNMLQALAKDIIESLGEAPSPLPRLVEPWYPRMLFHIFVLAPAGDDLVAMNRRMQAWSAQPLAMQTKEWSALTKPGRNGWFQTSWTERWLGWAEASWLPTFVADDTLHDVLRLAKAATLYKLKTGAYPQTLESLTPEYLAAIPVDRFDGKPLKMRAVPDGLILYSVGLNFTDDEGHRDWNQEVGDIAIYLGAPYAEETAKLRQLFARSQPN